VPRDLEKLRRLLKTTKGIHAPVAPAASYFRSLVVHSKNVASALETTVMATLAKYEKDHGTLYDSAESELVQAWTNFGIKVGNLKSKQFAEASYVKSAQGVNQFQRSAFLREIHKTIGVSVESTLNEAVTKQIVQASVQENIQLISSIEGSYAKRASRIIENSLLKGNDFSSIRSELLDLGGFKSQYQGTEIRRAKLIARDQTQKLTATLDRARQQSTGITHYFWDTTGDRRVRPSHQANDGKRFAYDNPPPTGHPGEEIDCRCVQRPDLTGLLTL